MEKNLHGLAWSLFLGRIAAVRPVECGHKTDVWGMQVYGGI